jgi:hypothetical protein
VRKSLIRMFRRSEDRGARAGRSSALAALAVFLLTFSQAIRCGAQSAESTGPASLDDYLTTSPDSAKTHEFSWLGIDVENGQATLGNRHRFRGVKVAAVMPGSPGAAAGLHGEREEIQAALAVGVLVASMFFPPAAIGALALESSGIGQSHDFIIAVDGKRTHDTIDFGTALDDVQPGEVVYLTIVRDGERKQLRVALPDIRHFLKSPRS